MTLEEIKAEVKKAQEHIESFNQISENLAKAGVEIEIETTHRPHGVVGIGRVEANQLNPYFTLDLNGD